ncbi:hypothetical protein [Sphingomonas sp. Ag1]|uniref:hypothetical protein n=1 Tax=Sphingomonas sp. Ag1 TaxID=1642949 RepID=UPI0006226438|nr:hypothetical protein [Sphingomonas sp. Ag1]KKI17481.1 hypothetical protein XM50_14305 [Sphingomonas sp. Ag1]
MIFSLSREQSEFHPSTAQRRLDRYRALLAGIEAAEVRSIAGGARLDFDRAQYALERLVKAQIEFAEAQIKAALPIPATDEPSPFTPEQEARVREIMEGGRSRVSPANLTPADVRGEASC